MDETHDTEEEASGRILKEELHAAVRALAPEDQRLVEAWYLSEQPMTEAAYAEEIGTTRRAVHHRKQKILQKLRSILAADRL